MRGSFKPGFLYPVESGPVRLTEREQSEQDAFLVHLDDAVRSLFDPDDITHTSARLLGEKLKVNRCAYADVEEDEDTFNLTGDFNFGVSSIVGRYRFAQFGDACLQAMRAGEPYIVSDSDSDARIPPEILDAYHLTQIRSVICMPVLKGGRFVAAMAVHAIEPRQWRSFEVQLLHLVANRCWESIERAHIARELSTSAERLRLAQKVGRIGSFEWYIPENRVVWTPELESLYGLPENSFEGSFVDWSKRVLPEDAERVRSLIADCLSRRGAELVYEFRAVLPSGLQRWLRGQSQFTYDETGEPLLMIGVNIDVDDQKRGEQALLESEARFRQAIDSMPQLVWSTLPNGFHDLYNRRWYEYTGLSFEETKGEQWRDVFHPDDRPLADARWADALATGQTYEVEYRCKRFDGAYRWFLGRATPIYDADGRISRWFGTCTDIHDQKLGEAALRKANRELEEFAYVASHDLQEPLRMVNIYTDLLLRKLRPGDPNLDQYAEFISKGVARMQALISDLLSFSRTVHAEEERQSRANLAEAFEEALSVFRNRIDETGASITVFGPLPCTRGETTQLAHVFENLLSNAIKYAHRDRTPQITVSASIDACCATISVQDNGIGFEQIHAERIFGLFKRLHKDEYPGTGLGLAICQRIIERYGGHMWAHGDPGCGSTFSFSLPIE